MQAFNDDPYLILIVYALMALPVVIAVVFLGLIVVAVIQFRQQKTEKARKTAIIASIIIIGFLLFELLTRAVL